MPHRDNKDERHGGELEGVDEGLLQQVPHGHLILEGFAHVTVEKTPDPIEVLDDDRSVDS